MNSSSVPMTPDHPLYSEGSRHVFHKFTSITEVGHHGYSCTLGDSFLKTFLNHSLRDTPILSPCEDQSCREIQGEILLVQSSLMLYFLFQRCIYFFKNIFMLFKKHIHWSSHCRIFLHGDNAMQKNVYCIFSIF